MSIGNTLLTIFVISCVLAVNVSAHSWIVCTDYKKENAGDWEENQCKAYPRNWKNHAQPFGVDTGYNHQDFSCKYSMAEGGYNANFPMATYNAGQKVCLVWPAKNHVASTSCTNQYIPDGGTEIFITARGATSDPSKDNWVKIADLGKNPNGVPLENGGGKGYQNCPKFCNNMDKAFCSGCFTLPANLTPGRYGFQWRWVFNPGTPYTSCWDADVLAAGAPNSGSNPTPVINNPPPANPDPTPNKPLVGNSVRLVNPPRSIPSNPNTFTVSLEYSADMTVDLVIDFMRARDYFWFGKAVRENVPAGKGTVDMTITVDSGRASQMSDGNFILKPWIVQAGFGADANKEGWTKELDRKEYQTVVGKTSAARPTQSVALFAIVLISILYLLL